MVKIIKYLLALIFAILTSIPMFSQQKIDVIANYNCSNYEISSTIVRDANFDGIYDTYTVNWCNGRTETYPIMAIGDIRRWPPTGIPTRDIMAASSSNNTFAESYFTMSTNIIFCWFEKQKNCDTVFYYDNNQDLGLMTDINEYSSENIEFSIAPNPANIYFDINYSLLQSGWVTIKLYNEIGILVDVIEEIYKSEGNYNIRYNLKEISSGKYFLTVKLGFDEIFTRQIIIEK